VWTAAGRAVTYLLVTRGEAGIAGVAPDECGRLREAEQREGSRAVGVNVVEFLDHRDGAIEEGLALRRDLAAGIRRHRPELVVTLNHHDTWGPGTWNTADHRHVGRAALDATSDAGNEWIFPEVAADGIEPWNGVRWVAVAGSPLATHAVAVDDGLEPAIASLAAHRRYLEGLDPATPAEDQARAWIERVTAMAADRFGGHRCVAFELVER
jgi:LmbE family N-acetylglucosaminyl deacetylase